MRGGFFFQAAGKLAHIACELQGGLPSAMFTCPSHGLGFRVWVWVSGFRV